MIHADPFIIKVKEGEVFTIKGLGDIHHLLKDSDEERFIEDLKTRTTEKTFFISLGDSLDSIGPSHKYFSLGRIKPKFLVTEEIKDGIRKLGDATKPLLDAEADSLVDILNQYTKPHEWIGHISGNHPLMLLSTGVDLMAGVCVKLKHRYLGYQAYIPLHVQSPGHNAHIMIFACHGFGGGGARWEGSGLNAYIQHSSRYEGWDIAMYGHRHDKWIKTLARIKPFNDSVSGKRWIKEDVKLICQTGSYLRTLARGPYPSYSEKAGMSPRPIGCISIQAKMVRVQKEGGSRELVIQYPNI